MPAGLGSETLFHLLILSSFSLFENSPTMENLVSFLGESSRVRLTTSVEHLQDLGFIIKNGPHLRLKDTRLIFGEGENSMSLIHFLRDALIHTTQNIETIFSAKEKTVLSTNLITVRSCDLKERLNAVRQELLNIQVGLDSNEGDDLLYFNVQIYPHSLVSRRQLKLRATRFINARKLVKWARERFRYFEKSN
jgi:hypothetical protein